MLFERIKNDNHTKNMNEPQKVIIQQRVNEPEEENNTILLSEPR